MLRLRSTTNPPGGGAARVPMGSDRANPAAGLSRDPRPFIAAAAERANAAARLVPKHPEQQPVVRSSLRDGPGDPSCLSSL